MDINLLVLSVGNSRLGIGVFSAGNLEYVTRLTHAQRGDWQGVIQQAWARIAQSDQPAVAAASVNPPLDSALDQIVKQVTAQPIQWVGRDLDVPIEVRTRSPSETGIDRVLNVAAAYEQIGKACVVVDAGTAVTVDCCGEDGQFFGGAIAPGVAMMLDALHQKTAKLPRVQLAVPDKAVGDSTESAISQGVFYAIRGLVKEVVENFASELGSWPEIIATGGDAPLLFKDWELIHALAPDLPLYGIALAYTNHHIKHGT
jgi:type III pantothenate kinase